MGIHYDYKSTRGEKAMKKEEEKSSDDSEKSEKNSQTINNEPEKKMHDIDKPITLEDLTNPDKS